MTELYDNPAQRKSLGVSARARGNLTGNGQAKSRAFSAAARRRPLRPSCRRRFPESSRGREGGDLCLCRHFYVSQAGVANISLNNLKAKYQI